MRDKKLVPYLVWAFVLAWPLQVLASWFALRGNAQAFRLILAGSMFAPLLAVLLAGIPLKDMGWKPVFRGNWKWFFAAWLAPALFMVLGAAVYFLVFPHRLDLTGKLFLAQLEAAGGQAALDQLSAKGLPVTVVLLVQVFAALTYAPFINILPSLGEEVGWRGAMLPRLKERFGRRIGRLLGGMIWGAWHWPVILLAGYEYGLHYWGFPVLGMLLFCVFCVVLGTFLDALYEKSGSVWFPALGHGAVNAVMGVPLLILDPAYADQTILGPSAIGAIAMLPLLIWGVFALAKGKKAGDA